jgi:hypothetical protein
VLLKQSATTYWEDLSNAVATGWDAFWFSTRSSQQLSIVRIATGLIALLYFASFATDFSRWLGPNSLLPVETVGRLLQDDIRTNYHYSLLALAKQPTELMALQGVAFVGAACLAIGLFSRVAAGITLVMLLSYVHRVPMVSGFSEPVLAMLLFYLCFVPSGEWFSVDAWLRRRKSGDDPQPSVMANLGTRLIQVHLAAFVFMMGMSKLSSEPWWQGDAIWYLIAQTQSRPVDLTALRASPFTINAWTHAIVAFEFAFPILVWNRLARPLLLVIGTVLWLSLALVSGHLLFALAMIAASAAFWSWSEPTPTKTAVI